jgi:predicted GNAT family acetyltransferase
MIRKLMESDRNSLLEYLNSEESLNIFFHANIKFYGHLHDGSLTLYGEFDEFSNYLSVLLLVSEAALFYSKNRQFNKEWLEILDNHKFSYISGVEHTIDKIIPYFKEYRVQLSFFAEASKLNEKYEKTNYNIVNVTTEEQCEKLYDLLKSMDEFVYRTKNKKDFIKNRMKALEMGSSYYIEENGKVISTATVSAETNNTALVMMVGTDVEYRNRGLASILIKHLMHEYIEVKQKSLCLFYDNPKAGKIYNRVGFKNVHKWIVLFKN